MGGLPCLVPDCRGKAFSSTLLRIMLAVGLSYMAFFVFFNVFKARYGFAEHLHRCSILYDPQWPCVVGVTTPVLRGESGSGETHTGTLFRALQDP